MSVSFLGLAISTIVFILMDQFQDAIYQREKWLVAGLFLAISWKSRKTGSNENLSVWN
jgi:hypothetical protein